MIASAPNAPSVVSPRRVNQRVVRAAGALVLAGGALLLNLWFWSATVRDEPVLIVVREVPAGQPLAAEDLGRREGRLPAETRARAIPAGQAADLIGQPAAQRLVPGDLVTAASVTAVPRPTLDQVAVAVGLKPELTPELAPGSRVAIIALGRAATTGGGGDDRAVLVRSAVVQSVSYPAAGLGSPLASAASGSTRAARVPSGALLLVATAEAGPVLTAAAAGGIAVALLPDGPDQPAGGRP